VRIDFSQFVCHSIVFPGHERVHASEDELLIDTDFSSIETVHAPIRTGTTLVGDVQFEREEVMESVLGKDGVHPEESAVTRA